MKRCLTVLLIALLISAALPSLPAAAERPDAPLYGKRGPFAVGTRDLKIPSDPQITGGAYALEATVWYPALKEAGATEGITYRWLLLEGKGRAILNADPDLAQAPYPLIIFSHGLSGLRYQLVSYTEHLASWGFVVIAADHPGSTFTDVVTGGREAILGSFARRPLEILRQIAFAETLTAPSKALEGMIDLNTIGVTGHSFGGYTTLSAGGARLDLGGLAKSCAPKEEDPSCAFAGAAGEIAALRGIQLPYDGFFPPTTDPRIKAIVPLAPSSGAAFGAQGAAALNLPMMLIVGSQDKTTVPERDAYPIYEGVSSAQKALVVLENAGHYIFVEECPPIAVQIGRYAQCSDLVWDLERAHDLINHFATAFFLYTLKGDQTVLEALEPTNAEFTGVRYQAVLKP